MYIRSLKVENYKCFLEETSFNFEAGFNVLLGGNSSGKTSVLECLEVFKVQDRPHRSVLTVLQAGLEPQGSSTIELGLHVDAGELASLLHPIPTAYISIGKPEHGAYSNDIGLIMSKLASSTLCLEFSKRFRKDTKGRLRFEDWPTDWRMLASAASFSCATLSLADERISSVQNLSTDAPDLRNMWERVSQRTYRFFAERKVAASSSHTANTALIQDASNLAYCLNVLQSNDPVGYHQLCRLITRVFPTIHWISASPNASNQFEIKIQTSSMDSRRTDLAVGIDQVGTGVFNAVAMLYIAVTNQIGQILLLEEPNSFLHPRALRELLAILREVGSHHQYFVTTHSSDVLRTISPSTVSLLEHDGKTTKLKQTTGSQFENLRSGLIDLGIRLTDLHGCDRVLWVEGQSEVAIFPILLRAFFPHLAEGIAVLPVFATGDFEQKRISAEKVAQIYRRLSQDSFMAPPMVAITLDREGRQESEIERVKKSCEGLVHFLPKAMLEDYLLMPESIADLLREKTGKSITTAEVHSAIEAAKTDPNNWLKPRSPQKSHHAGKILGSVFRSLGGDGSEYDKTRDGPEIARKTLEADPDYFNELKVWLQAILELPES